MEIRSVRINSFTGFGMDSDCEGRQHVKSLNFLSVVQAVEGSYDIALGDGPLYSTGEGGIFIAPADVTQRITHHNGASGRMRARWAFIDATVNDFCAPDDLYEFPVLLPAGQCAAAGELIAEIGGNGPICERYAAVYRLLGMLMETGTLQPAPDDTLLHIRRFVTGQHARRIGAKDIADEIHCSVSQVFRYTRKYFGMSPANYINSVRLRRAAELLELTRESVGEIARSVGFDDLSYFSRLFGRAYGMAPGSYRRFRNG